MTGTCTTLFFIFLHITFELRGAARLLRSVQPAPFAGKLERFVMLPVLIVIALIYSTWAANVTHQKKAKGSDEKAC